jgi:hypothetical protein
MPGAACSKGNPDSGGLPGIAAAKGTMGTAAAAAKLKHSALHRVCAGMHTHCPSSIAFAIAVSCRLPAPLMLEDAKEAVGA